jgi:glycosyltransferase involved in cell wall biosynthesis
MNTSTSQVSLAQTADCRVLIVSHYASELAGGEGSIPLRLFGRLRARGTEAWLLTHVGAREELRLLLPAAEYARVIFARGLPGFGPVFSLGERLPPGLRTLAWAVTQLERQIAMVPVARRLVKQLAIDVVHQPISVSPVIPSPLSRLGAPVVMGPLNGGMGLPSGFANRDSPLNFLVKATRPAAATMLNALMPGRRRADRILVANDRTKSLLPASAQTRTEELSDIGVVLAAIDGTDAPPAAGTAAASSLAAPTRFLYVGRLVDWKAVDVLLDAFTLVKARVPASLEIVGEGPERDNLMAQAERSGHGADVCFAGWLGPEDCLRRVKACDVYVSASLQEAGGIAVLEAMACERPVIATAWGGHMYSVDKSAGILVDVTSRPVLVQGLADAMVSLARDAGLRARLGAGGRRRVESRYDWDAIVDHTLQVYREVRAPRSTSAAGQNS